MPPWYVTSFAWTASSFWAELFVGSCDVDSVSQCKEVRMAAHIITDTACLPSVTSCSCSHNHVKPAAHSQRLTQRSSSFVSSQHTCRLPRRRLGRDSTQVWTAYSGHAALQTVSALWLVMASWRHCFRCTCRLLQELHNSRDHRHKCQKHQRVM